MDRDEEFYLRDTLATLNARLDTIEANAEFATGPSDFIGVTFKEGTTYPTAAKSVFAVRKANPGGAETEGTAVTATVPALAAVVKVGNIGNTVPPVGTTVSVTTIGGKLVMSY